MTDAPSGSDARSGGGAPRDGPELWFGKRTAQQRVTLGVAWFALILMVAFVLSLAATSPSALSNPWADLAFAALLATFALGAYSTSRLKPFDIRDGFVTLPWPIRDASGRKRGNLPLAEIRSVAPARSERQDSGVLVSLKDGTTFYLWDPDLPSGASAYLLRLKGGSPPAAKPDGRA